MELVMPQSMDLRTKLNNRIYRELFSTKTGALIPKISEFHSQMHLERSFIQ
jgi:hypothetical protein